MPLRTAIACSLVIFKAFCVAAIMLAMLVTVYSVGPRIETAYFPVVSKLRIVDLKAADDGDALIWAEFTKLRRCEYIGIAWYRGQEASGFERVPVALLRRSDDESSPNRPIGRQRTGPWKVGIPPIEIAGNSFAKLSHRCHTFWITTTDFYP